MKSDRIFKQAIAPYSSDVRERLSTVRLLVHEAARGTKGVGKVVEALKWNQFSFLTTETGSGSTIRIDGRRDDPDKFAVYFHCQSGLVGDFKQRYPGTFTFEDDRALVFEAGKPLPMAELKHCISLALTHHLRKKLGKPKRK